MKRKVKLIIAFLCFLNTLTAQTEFVNDWDSLFRKLPTSGLTSKSVLWNKGMADSSVLLYKSTASGLESDFNVWDKLYRFWESSNLDSNASIRNSDSTLSELERYRMKGVMVIPMLYILGDRIHPDAFKEGHLTLDSIERSIQLNNAQGVFMPCNVFCAAPYVQTTFNGKFNFLIHDSFVFSNTAFNIKRIEYRINGGAFREFFRNTVNTLDFVLGTHEVELKVFLMTGEVMASKFIVSYLDYKTDIDASKLNSIHIGDINYNIYAEPYRTTETGEPLGAYISVLPGKNGNVSNACIKKPIIFVEGIDFGYKDHATGCYGGKCGSMGLADLMRGRILNPYEFNPKKKYEDWEPIKKAPELITKLQDLGYDLIYLDFHNGADYMENNAMLLVDLIKRVNYMKCSAEELVIIGASMGGEVSKFALSYMESKNIDHCSRLLLEFDSPNEGANIPLGFQKYIEFFSGKLPTVRDQYNRKLARAATKQLLMEHFLSADGHSETQSRIDFKNELNKIGNYPKYPRLVALLNGSITPSPQSFQPGERLLEMNPYLGTLNFDILEVYACVWATYYTTGGDNMVLYAKYPFKKKTFKVPAETEQFDHVTGSKRYDLKDARRILVLFNIINRQDASCFIPTYSALGLTKENRTENIRDEIAMNRKTNRHPFDAYYGPENGNQEHMMLTTENINWIIEQLEKNSNDLPNTLTRLYNFGREERKNLNSVNVLSNGVLQINGNHITGLTNGKYDVPAIAGSVFHVYTVMCQPVISIWGKGKLEIGETPQGPGNRGVLHIRKGAKLVLRPNSELLINDASTLIIEEGAEMVVHPGAKIILDGHEALLQIDGLLSLENGAILKIESGQSGQTGYIKFRNNGKGEGLAKLVVSSGTASIDLNGTNNEKDHIMQVEGHVDLSANGSIKNTKMRNCKLTFANHSSIQMTGNVSLDSVNIRPTDWAEYASSSPINIDKANTIDISNCTFERFDMAMKIQGGASSKLSIVKSDFSKCEVGVYANIATIETYQSVFNICNEVALSVGEINQQSILDAVRFKSCGSGISMANSSGPNPFLFVSDCEFITCKIGNDLINVNSVYACSRFFNNKRGIRIEGGELNLSVQRTTTNTVKSSAGGNNTFVISTEIGIDLNQTLLFIDKGQNNFLASSGNSSFKHLTGEIAFSSLTHNMSAPFELKASDNYWVPKPKNGLQSGLNVIYNIKFPYPGSGGMTSNYLSGSILNKVNEFCFMPDKICNPCEIDFIGNEESSELTTTDIKASVDKITVYPQPADNYLILSGITWSGDLSAKILDIEGRVVKTTILENEKDAIDTSELQNGVYVLEYQSSAGKGFITILIAHH